ncbi:MAG: exodeoxyribonuclease VII large subunit [Anaerolineaceae bacterium]|nr:exodeoxyribonuclease VII large subunit [Anaerolineaceae bacterium]
MEQLPFFENEEKIFTVSDVNRLVAGVMRAVPDLQDCWIAGEVSKVSIPTSGHCYLSLKDNNSEIKAVVWRSNLTAKIRELLTTGNAVEAHGYISVYEKGGYYQLTIDSVRPKGRGNIYEELEKLRKKLAAEGLFDEERKRPIPRIPRTIGVVTSPSGAALQDILNTLRGRWPLAEVWLSPASVQGDGAPPEIIASLLRLYDRKPDVIILARGGGSAEDLWCFNDEALVRTVAASPIPIITGVGHEVDFTLVDFASDLRAPTPTGAAVRAVPSKDDILAELDQLEQRLDWAMDGTIQQSWQGIDLLEKRLQAQSPEMKIKNEKRALDQISARLDLLQKNYFESRQNSLDGLEKRLLALNPENIMKRGYAFVRRGEKIVTSANTLNSGDRIDIRFIDGEKSALVE